MIISIIEGGPFAPCLSEEEELKRAFGISGRHRIHPPPSPVRYLAAVRAVRPAGALHLQNYDGRPIFQIRYKFGRGVRKRRRKEERDGREMGKETSLNL